MTPVQWTLFSKLWIAAVERRRDVLCRSEFSQRYVSNTFNISRNSVMPAAQKLASLTLIELTPHYIKVLGVKKKHHKMDWKAPRQCCIDAGSELSHNESAVPEPEPEPRPEPENTKGRAARNHRLPKPTDDARVVFGIQKIRGMFKRAGVRSPAHLVAVAKSAKTNVKRATEMLVQVIQKPPPGITIKNYGGYVARIFQNESARKLHALASEGALEFLKAELQARTWKRGDPECERCGFPLNDADDAKMWKTTAGMWTCRACLTETQKGA